MYNKINEFIQGTFLIYGIIETIILMLIFLFIAYILKKILKKWLSNNNPFAFRVCKVIISGVAIYACLSLIIPFESVLTKIWSSAGILAIVIGLIAQEASSNFVNGLFINFFKPFQVGDLIRINQGQYVGYVVDISLRDTTIETSEKTRIIIPNSVINKEVLENVNQENQIKNNFLTLQISYDSDIDKAISIIQEEVRKHPLFINPCDYDLEKVDVPVVLTSFEDSGINLRASIYSNSQSEGFKMLCDLRLTLKHRFDEANISFPYPTRTIIMKKEDENHD